VQALAHLDPRVLRRVFLDVASEAPGVVGLAHVVVIRHAREEVVALRREIRLRPLLIADLVAEHLVTFDRASSYTELTQALFREAGIVPRGTIELDNIDAAKKCVAQGLGVALLPRQAVREELAAGTLRPVVIAGARPIRRRIVAIRRRDAGAAVPTVAAFLDLIRATQAGLRGSSKTA